MNFFEYQDRARRNSRRLIGLYALAVVSIVCSVYGVAVLALGLAGRRRTVFAFWQPQLFFLVAIAVLLIIGIGSLYKILALRQGGAVIAVDLGGRMVIPEMADPMEKQLLNVVEEMAIAAGISVPSVYVMDHESGINAFAAGFTPNNAVIGVTRGALEQLSRDELQGVIGHEFSHILNGDMGLNLKLVGMLNGILLIYILGRILMESGYWSRRDRDSNGLWVGGLGLIVIGSVGMLFGRIIQSAVSRQREFLADASAVQFTRNPDGIAGALKKIAGHGSQIRAPQAEANSHMFFGSALTFNFMEELFATHPPVGQRIQRLERGQSRLGGGAVHSEAASIAGRSLAMGFAGGTDSTQSRAAESRVTGLPATPNGVVAQVGTVAPEHFAYAKALLAEISEPLQNGIRETNGAIAVLYGLMLDAPDSSVRSQQIAWLKNVESPEILQHVQQLSTEIDALNPRTRLPLLDLTVPALRQSSPETIQRLFKCLQGLAKIDGRWSLSEFVSYTVLWHRLQPVLNPKAEKTVQFTTLEAVWVDCLNLLSVLARVGQNNPDAIAHAFRSGITRLPGAKQRGIPDAPPTVNFPAVKQSLERLSTTAPRIKQVIVDACAHTVLLDNTVTVQEADLLRAIVIVLDCPIPPFLNASPGSESPSGTPA